MPDEVSPRTSRMEALTSLCKKRGYLFQSSDIYGGLNGFWDYGPLGVELKRNVKECWWREMISAHNHLMTLPNAPGPFEMVGLDCTIIMHPQVWKCSGHYDLFHDYMVDCRETKKRFRYDQINGRWVEAKGQRVFVTTERAGPEGEAEVEERALKFFNLRKKQVDQLSWDGQLICLDELSVSNFAHALAPTAKSLGTLTEPREFNLMFKTTIGALGSEEDVAFLRPETAQGIFVNFKNVCDTTRVRIPFGIGQIGKSFRNEITPRNFTFRSREFEQMEIEFFCHPEQSSAWYQYWRNRRYQWYLDLGLSQDRLILRDHDPAELAHYSIGTADIEYSFPFLPEGSYGELEGVAHRGDFDLRSHMEGKLCRNESGELVVEIDQQGQPRHRGSGKDLSYRDDLSGDRFVPHVIEPSAGADRAALAFLCEAYREDQQPDRDGNMRSRTLLGLHPRLAPYKAAIFPLDSKDDNKKGQIAQEIFANLKANYNVFYDEKGNIGRLYRRQDEIGTPFCITVDDDTLQDNTVTFRDRDSLEQWRVRLDDCLSELQRLIQ